MKSGNKSSKGMSKAFKEVRFQDVVRQSNIPRQQSRQPCPPLQNSSQFEDSKSHSETMSNSAVHLPLSPLSSGVMVILLALVVWNLHAMVTVINILLDGEWRYTMYFDDYLNFIKYKHVFSFSPLAGGRDHWHPHDHTPPDQSLTFILHSFVDFDFPHQLRKLRAHWFQFDSHFFASLNIHTHVQVTERTTVKLSAQSVLLSYPQIHTHCAEKEVKRPGWFKERDSMDKGSQNFNVKCDLLRVQSIPWM